MNAGRRRQSFISLPSARWGALLIAVGEGLVVAHHRPASDFYFPFVWLGFTLLLDAALVAYRGASLFSRRPKLFLAFLLLSTCFWWLFELLNVPVQNWRYVGAGRYTGLSYVVFASLDFSFVLPAVWNAAQVMYRLLPAGMDARNGVRGSSSRSTCADGRGVGPVLEAATDEAGDEPWWAAGGRDSGSPPSGVLVASAIFGIVCVALPVIFPTYCFGMIWLSLFFLLDPINARLGRPSVLVSVWRGAWRLPLALALGTLLCGFFWESWNYWAMPKWVYSIPYVGFWHIFEMPLLGWSGYLPFGLELFAMTNFVLPLFGLGTVVLDDAAGVSVASAAPARGPASAPTTPSGRRTAY